MASAAGVFVVDGSLCLSTHRARTFLRSGWLRKAQPGTEAVADDEGADDRFFAALASPDRLAILRELCVVWRENGRTGSLNIGEVAARTEQSRFSASRNLAILRDAGLVIGARDGYQVRHRLDASGFEPLEDWLYPVMDVLAQGSVLPD
ncbi:ArsR/SmtB family transcription factor [Microbacterium sp. HJ5]